MKTLLCLATLLLLLLSFTSGCKKNNELSPDGLVGTDTIEVKGNFAIFIPDAKSDVALIRRYPEFKSDVIATGTRNSEGILTSIKNLVMFNPNSKEWLFVGFENGYPVHLNSSSGYSMELKNYNKNDLTVEATISLNGTVVTALIKKKLPAALFNSIENNRLNGGRILEELCDATETALKILNVAISVAAITATVFFPPAGIYAGAMLAVTVLGTANDYVELTSGKSISEHLVGEDSDAAKHIDHLLNIAQVFGPKGVAQGALATLSKIDQIVDLFTGIATWRIASLCDWPKRWGKILGDPHITTLDGINYDFQGHGEFIATKSTTDNFEVQVRQEDVYQSGQASVNTAVGVQTGTDIVCVTVKPNRLFINNQLQNLNGLTTLSLQNGASVSKTTEKGKDLLSITTKNGDIIRVVFQAPEYLDYYLALSENRQGKVIGLIGNYDGDKTNDIVVRNGENILTNGGLSFQKLYPTYADSWRIAQRNSLFYYDAGKTTDSYTEKDFPRSVFTLTNDQKTKAEGICRAAGVSSEPYLSNCIVDVAITNNAALAASALWGQEKNAHEPSPTTEIVPPASSLGSYTFLSGTWRYENGTECLYIPDTKSATLTKLPTNNVFGFVVDEDCWRNVTSSGTNQWTYDQLIRTANGGMTYYKSTAIAKGRDSLSVDTQNFGKYFIVRVR